MVDVRVVEKENDRHEIGLWRFDSNFLAEDKGGIGREGLI